MEIENGIRGERIIRYSNNIRIRIRQQIETRILFLFVQNEMRIQFKHQKTW